MKSNSGRDSHYVTVANTVAFLCVLLYAAGKIRVAWGRQDYGGMGYIFLWMIVLLVYQVVAIRRVKYKGHLGFYIPMGFMFYYAVHTFRNQGSPYFFIIYLCMCGFSTLYFDYKSLVAFVVCSNGIFILLQTLLGVCLVGVECTHAELVVSWALAGFCSVFLIIMSRYSTNRNVQAVRGRDSFDTLLATTPNIIALVDEKNCIRFISRSLADLAHIENPELAMGRPLLDVFLQPEMKTMISNTLNAHGYYENTEEIFIEGESRWWKVVSNTLSGGTKGRFIDINDVTPIMRSKIEAEQATHAKNDFLAKMSHEIRTPMNAIVGMSELILRESLPLAVHDYAINIKQASTNLLSIINDLLDFTKIESGRLQIVETPYLFGSLINDIISIVRLKIVEKPILFTANIDSNIPNALIGDELRIRQIILNLLSNAYKYSQEGFISLTVEGRTQGPGQVELVIEVADSGIGIQEKDLAKLFDDFSQMDLVRNRGIEGSGLGLSITKSLCEAMGGHINVQSEYGKGSVFTVCLPQKFASDEPLARVENPQEYHVLVYIIRDKLGESLSRSLSNLQVPSTWVSNQSQLYECLQKGGYTHVFTSYVLLEGARNALEKSHLDAQLVLLSEFGHSQPIAHVQKLSMPAYSMSIANVLNNQAEQIIFRENLEDVVRFIAPDARVLIVDDIMTNLKVAEGLMLPYQLHIDICSSGPEAIERVMQARYDLVFMDHMMPYMDGIEATSAIRNLPDPNQTGYFKNLPIVALTANAVFGVREMFLVNGFNDFLAKPIEINKLNSILEQWIPKEKQQKYTAQKPVRQKQQIEIEGIDMESGLAMAAGSLENYWKMLGIFLMEGKEKRAEMQACFDAGDIPLFTAHAHALKSALANIGARQLAEFAKSMELAGRREDMLFINMNTPVFLSDFEALLRHIESAIPAAGSEIKITASQTELARMLAGLRQAVENMDNNLADGVLGQMQKQVLPQEIKTRLQEVTYCLLISEYEEALQHIDQMIEQLQ